ncbi:MAG TPA: hypothetical protein DCE18_00450 [Syntrophobacteraceae bacterium]|nr:hypothetical protein [Syntrophobacteraceae bacterium]
MKEAFPLPWRNLPNCRSALIHGPNTISFLESAISSTEFTWKRASAAWLFSVKKSYGLEKASFLIRMREAGFWIRCGRPMKG